MTTVTKISSNTQEDRLAEETFEKQKQFFREKELKHFRRIVNKSRYVREVFELPANDFWIKDFSCAIERGILWHGRMYITRYHLCFYANIFGKVTKEKVSWSSVKGIEKDTHGLINPSLIVYSTHDKENHKSQYNRQYFASFGSRDKSFDRLMKTWLSPPNIADKNNVSISTFLAVSNQKKKLDVQLLHTTTSTGDLLSPKSNTQKSRNALSSLSESIIGQSGILNRISRTYTSDSKHKSQTNNGDNSHTISAHPKITKDTPSNSSFSQNGTDVKSVHKDNTDSDESTSDKDQPKTKSQSTITFAKEKTSPARTPRKTVSHSPESTSADHGHKTHSKSRSVTKERQYSVSIKPTIILYIILLFILFGALFMWIWLIDRQLDSIRVAVNSSHLVIEKGLINIRS